MKRRGCIQCFSVHVELDVTGKPVKCLDCGYDQHLPDADTIPSTLARKGCTRIRRPGWGEGQQVLIENDTWGLIQAPDKPNVPVMLNMLDRIDGWVACEEDADGS